MDYSAVVFKVVMKSQLAKRSIGVYYGEVSLFDKNVISMKMFDYRDVYKFPKHISETINSVVQEFFKDITNNSVSGSELIIKPFVKTNDGVFNPCAIVGEYHTRFVKEIDVEHMDIASYDRFQEYMKINLLKDYDIDSPNFAKLIAKKPNVFVV